MARKCLREVASCFASRADFLGVHADMVTMGQHSLQHQAGIFHSTGICELFCQPATATAENPFDAAHSIICCLARIVATYQRLAGCQLLLNAVDSLNNVWISRSCKLGKYHQQCTRINRLASSVLHETLLVLTPNPAA